MLVLSFLLLGPTGGSGQSLSRAPKSSLPVSGQAVAAPIPEWTVMVFMDGDNNLELDALQDFEEMAEVGSTDKVNIVVQLDRIGKYAVGEQDKDGNLYENWDETLRFYITKGMKPERASALKEPRCQSPEVKPPRVCTELNMGKGDVLRDFITWAKTQYPAQHYILVIWDHGQGYRKVIPNTSNNRSVFGRMVPPPPTHSTPDGQSPEQIKLGDMVMADPFRSALGSPYRSASHDETDDDQLYNLEIQKALQDSSAGQKLDVLGFDACLMEMVETAYAMRDQATVMVGSEDLEPGAGWQYNDWLNTLVGNSARGIKMDANSLGKLLVESYKNQYEPTPRRTTTQSAVDLTKADALAKAVSTLADEMSAKMSTEASNIKAARDECAVFAPNPFDSNPPKDYFFHIDFIRFCDRLIAHTGNQGIRDKALAARNLAASSVIASYAGRDRQGNFGSNGLAIYFPASESLYKGDQYAQNGYEKSNTNFPVEFVQKQTWGDFLHEYFKRFK
jgi:hypothetical protein